MTALTSSWRQLAVMNCCAKVDHYWDALSPQILTQSKLFTSFQAEFSLSTLLVYLKTSQPQEFPLY